MGTSDFLSLRVIRAHHIFHSQMTSIPNTQGPPKDRVRDKEFFLEDGNCVVLAESTLFKVFQLVFDSSISKMLRDNILDTPFSTSARLLSIH
jgi:hypothetical protein